MNNRTIYHHALLAFVVVCVDRLYSANGMESGTALCTALPWTQDRPPKSGALCFGRSGVRTLAALPNYAAALRARQS